MVLFEHYDGSVYIKMVLYISLSCPGCISSRTDDIIAVVLQG